MKLLRRLLLLVLFIGAVFVVVRFSNANDGPVGVDLLLIQLQDVALWLVLLIAFAAGAVLMAILLLFELARKSLITRRMRKHVESLEAEVNQLRTLPLAESGSVAPPPVMSEPEIPGDEIEDRARASEEA